MKRRVTAELLDDDLGTPEEIADSLRDLRHINTGLVARGRRSLFCGASLDETGQSRVVDFWKSGAGLAMFRWMRSGRSRREGITAADHASRSSVVASAYAWGNSFGRLATPCVCHFADDSFDVMSSSLFAHHFDPGMLPLLLQEALRVVSARCSDQRSDPQSRLHLLLMYLGLPLFRSRITWHDAPASVRRAYTIDEMRSMLAEVPAQHVEVSSSFLFRMGVLIWKQHSREDAEQPAEI